jgi:hypothetical protein
MEDEEKYRVESIEEETEERTGFFKPLPSPPSVYTKTGKDGPVVKFLGISMTESRKDTLLVLIIPLLAGIIDTNIMAYIVTNILEIPTMSFFVLSIIIAIPVGLTQTSAGRAVIGGLLNSLFFFLLFVAFLSSPSFFAPIEAPLGEFLIPSIITTIGYFILNLPAAILGSFFGQILRELF